MFCLIVCNIIAVLESEISPPGDPSKKLNPELVKDDYESFKGLTNDLEKPCRQFAHNFQMSL